MNSVDKMYDTKIYSKSADFRTNFDQFLINLNKFLCSSILPDIEAIGKEYMKTYSSRKYRLVVELEYNKENAVTGKIVNYFGDGTGFNQDEQYTTNLDKTNKRIKDEFFYYIKKHLGDDNLNHDDLARKLGLCRSLYYKKIKELVGVTPNEYLKNVRIKEAAWLLAEPKLPVSEVMVKVGFKDPKYFRDCFKKVYGLSPVKFRKS